MERTFAKKIGLAALLIGTLVTLSFIMMKLKKEDAVATDKTIHKKENIEPRPQGLIQEALLPKQSELENCYESYLQKRPEQIEGFVVIHWLIDPKGAVISTELAKSELEDPDLKDCVLAQLKELSFAPPPDGRKTVLSYKLHFRHKSQAALNFEN